MELIEKTEKLIMKKIFLFLFICTTIQAGRPSNRINNPQQQLPTALSVPDFPIPSLPPEVVRMERYANCRSRALLAFTSGREFSYKEWCSLKSNNPPPRNNILVMQGINNSNTEENKEQRPLVHFNSHIKCPLCKTYKHSKMTIDKLKRHIKRHHPSYNIMEPNQHITITQIEK